MDSQREGSLIQDALPMGRKYGYVKMWNGYSWHGSSVLPVPKGVHRCTRVLCCKIKNYEIPRLRIKTYQFREVESFFTSYQLLDWSRNSAASMKTADYRDWNSPPLSQTNPVHIRTPYFRNARF
jgi:hypothetical protein